MQIAIGFVTDFFDTLGIGSFATTTAVFKVLKVVPDEQIVGTMIIGHSLPVVVQAFIFVVVVLVDPTVLVSLIAVSVFGSWLGAGVASTLPRRRIDSRAALGLTLGGIPGVLIAGLLVRALPLNVLRWVVAFVVAYAAITMLRSASSPRLSPAEARRATSETV